MGISNISYVSLYRGGLDTVWTVQLPLNFTEHSANTYMFLYGRFYAVLHNETRYIEVPWASQSLRRKQVSQGKKWGGGEGFLGPRGGTGSCQGRRYQQAGQPGSAGGKQVHEVLRAGRQRRGPFRLIEPGKP